MSYAKRAVCCGLSLALSLGCAPSLAFAVPQADLDAAQARLSELGGSLASVEAELDELTAQLESTDNAMERTQGDIDQTQVQLAEARGLLSKHVRSGYKSGGFDVVEFLMSSGSLEDFVSRFYYMDKVTQGETEEINTVNELENQLTDQLIQLKTQRDEQASRVDETQSKVGEYQGLVSEARDYYNQLDAQVQAELAAQAAAAAAAAQAQQAQTQQSSLATAVAAIDNSAATSEGDGGAYQPADTGDNGGDGGAAPYQPQPADDSYSDDSGNDQSYDGGGQSDGGGSSSSDDSWEPSEPADTGSAYPGGGVSSAYSCIGYPYVWGGYSPSMGGFDCSGLVSYCFGDGSWRRGCESLAYAIQDAGLWKYGMDNLNYGDLVFTDSEYNHVGIYIGGGMMIHSPKPGFSVCVTSVWSCYGGGPFC